ncbi:pneumococcal serine-rich repeat protein [Drosophila nasuta]|uniref:pneumococcal serine-rich repeat protein n=1 Tax=Drosophila nasuta TaxID=42062 RepID=UPI00295E96B2|nr:pneumococcal serine-rich repeat protein [Drosophila nasuta]
MSDNDYRFGFGKDKIKINKLKHDGLWRLNLNNNNNLVEFNNVTQNFVSPDGREEEDQAKLQWTMAKAKQKQQTTTTAAAATATTTGTAAATTTATIGAVAVTPTCVAHHIEDEGGGDEGAGSLCCAAAADDVDCAAAVNAGSSDKLNGFDVGAAYALTALPPLNCDLAAATAATATLAAAASALSPTDAAVGGLSSSRTSMNSTENLSYASDNYYGDDLILLDDDDDDDDVDAEEISLNSDDCVYAYRGDAADYDMAALDASTGRGGRKLDFSLLRDDETDFLEMDFEPDPSSELEFAANGAQEAAAAVAAGHANLLLMQRDYSQLQHGGRQLYSSPIEELSQPQEALQRLSKKFARISLNLDQIKTDADAGSDVDADELLCGSKADNDEDGYADTTATEAAAAANTTLAHSLPSTLVYSSFSRSTSVPSEHVLNAEQSSCNSKLTGAKPKRLSTLSNSSSLVSAGKSCGSSSTSKSRRSQPSFDERCYSCTDFRAVSLQHQQLQQQQQQQQQSDVAPMLVAAAAVVAASAAMASNSTQFDLGSGEETCLDCLEKEFLANTIGKALDLSSCSKCRRRIGSRGSSISLYARAEQTRCRSGSPGYLDKFGGLFSWHNSPVGAACGGGGGGGDIGHYNQRFISCDNNFGGVQLPKQSFSTEPLVARLSTAHLSEEHLVQALDKLHVSYNASLLHGYFEQLSAPSQPDTDVGNLKQLLLHVSKRQCNHRKLKKLIALITQQQQQEPPQQQQQLNVQFKRSNAGNAAFVPVKVTEILAAWKRHPDLSVLRQLDARFHRANVMGKIGHIVRQAQHQQPASSSAAAAAAATTSASASASAAASTSISSTRLALPEFIMIPQYYACGELTLTRKC